MLLPPQGRAPEAFLEPGGGLGRPVAVDVDHGHGRPLPGQPLGHRPAEAAGRPGHAGDPSLEANWSPPPPR
jgi:hypothetical protein